MGEHSQEERDRSEENCDNLDTKSELNKDYTFKTYLILNIKY